MQENRQKMTAIFPGKKVALNETRGTNITPGLNHKGRRENGLYAGGVFKRNGNHSKENNPHRARLVWKYRILVSGGRGNRVG